MACRAIGDRVLKRYVTAQPDIKERRVSAHDRFLVIASDGLWDVMSNEEVGDMIYKISKPEVRPLCCLPPGVAKLCLCRGCWR